MTAECEAAGVVLDSPAPVRSSAPSRRGGLGVSTPEWVDRFLGSDPGFVRLLIALQAVATIGVAMLVESIFVRLTHAMQIDTHGATLPPSQAALVAAQHHGVLVVAILLGAIVGMIASFSAAMFVTPRDQLVSFALMPVPMIAGLSIGLSLATHRILALTSFVVILAGGAYLRRFGPRGFVGGMLFFMGDFFGFFLHGAITIADIDWLTAEICIGAAVAIIAQFTLFFPSRRAALRRMVRSYVVRAREVAAAAIDLLDEPDNNQRGSRRLHRRLVRLNETALVIDAQLGQTAALPRGVSAGVMHQRIFDAELGLTNMARFAERITSLDLTDEIRRLIRAALDAVGRHDIAGAEQLGHDLLTQLRIETHRHGAHSAESMDRTTHVVVHRFAISVLGFTDAANQGIATVLDPKPTSGSPDPEPDTDADAFAPSVMLFGGFLPGSAMVSAAASLEPAIGPRNPTVAHRMRIGDRARLAPYSRVAIQLAVAVTAAIILGDLLSGRRFYWAVIAVFVTFMGSNNSGEQVRKGLLRLAGTVVGVFIGAVLAHVVGQRTDLAIAVILLAIFFALYLMRVNYAFMVIGVTVMVSQLYVQLNEFTNSLLVLRLEETAIGAGVAVLTVICIFPLPTARVVRVATRQYVEAMAQVVTEAVQVLTGAAGRGADNGELRAATRRLDAAYQALVVTVSPLRFSVTRAVDAARKEFLSSVAASRNYARNLLVDTASAVQLSPFTQDELGSAGQRLTASIEELADALNDPRRSSRSYVRSASLFDLVATQHFDDDFTAPGQLALRDFQLLDGALATLAKSAGLAVRALDAPDPVGSR